MQKLRVFAGPSLAPGWELGIRLRGRGGGGQSKESVYGETWWVALGGGWEGTQPLFINSDAHKECKVSTVQIYI